MSGQGQTDPNWSTHHVPVQPEEHADIYFRFEYPLFDNFLVNIVGLFESRFDIPVLLTSCSPV